MPSAPDNIARPFEVGEPRDTGEQLQLLTHKIDVLSQQVEHLYRRSMALEELKDELTHVARDAMGALQEELSEIEHEFNTEAITHLLRKLVRSTPRLIRLLQTLESMQDMADELGPLGKEMVRDLTDRLQHAEQRGYFRLLNGGLTIADQVAQNLTQEDIDRLAEQVPRLVGILKSLTEPRMLDIAGEVTGVLAAGEGERPAPVGIFGLLGAMRDPGVQAGLGVMVEILRRVAPSGDPERLTAGGTARPVASLPAETKPEPGE
jgi:uncharacterized protein YjgD (DUF1641 family)